MPSRSAHVPRERIPVIGALLLAVALMSPAVSAAQTFRTSEVGAARGARRAAGAAHDCCHIVRQVAV